MKKLLLVLLLSSCSHSATGPSADDKPIPAIDSPEAQTEMCTEEHVGVLRFSRAYLAEFCPQLKSQLELTCFRFVHSTKDYRKACVGISSLDQLECISTIANAQGFAEQVSLEKCRAVKNRKQVFCLSRLVAKSGIPLPPDRVQDCLDRNSN